MGTSNPFIHFSHSAMVSFVRELQYSDAQSEWLALMLPVVKTVDEAKYLYFIAQKCGSDMRPDLLDPEILRDAPARVLHSIALYAWDASEEVIQ